MRVVIDTNVLVSALLTPDRTPARALDAVAREAVTVLLDARIEAEYRDVLARPRFAAIAVARREALLTALLGASERVVVTRSVHALIDDDDRMFVEVALGGGADAIVTGNAKHFPSTLGVEVLSPAALLARLGDAPGY